MARYIYKDHFEFLPVFKVWIAANHKPTIRGTDEAIWRRLRFIPFETFIKPEDRDPDLERKLRDELPGILNWAIEGCLEWRKNRLPVPQAIRNATEAYRSEMDVVGSWISEHCVVQPGLELCFDEGYKHFAPWCEENFNFAFSKKKVGMLLTERGFLKKSKPQRVYVGLTMRSELTRSQLDKFDKQAEFNALKSAITAVPNDLEPEGEVK
jgi:phage/plasmid-associated DNA primase